MRSYTSLLAATLLLAPLTTAANPIEETLVSATRDARRIDVAGDFSISPDVATLVKRAPGANVNSNGPLSGIPQYRGMFGPRVAVLLDGAQLSPAGPNWMDPPLSYAAAGGLDSLEVYRGIVPVSVAQETIGGAVAARTRHGSFTTGQAATLQGRIDGAAQSVNEGHRLDTALYASNASNRLRLAASTERGDDADFADGTITPTEYSRQRYDAGYGVRLGEHTLQFDYGYNDTGDTGTPALPMDIESIEGDLYNLGYTFDPDGDISVAAAIFASDLDHTMTNYHLRQAPGAEMWRRNTATSNNAGFNLGVTLRDGNGSWRLGADGFSSEHDADIDNPNSPGFFVVNFNDARREILGAYLEREQRLSQDWHSEVGLRYNRVSSDADTVDGTPAMMMPPAQALRDTFNSADRSRNDDNIDLVARLWYSASEQLDWYAGMAQKHRSPSYQERYLWLPLESTGGLADGFTYTGNIDLDPEVSRQVELGFDFSGKRLTISPRLFYNRVEDYIQGTPSEVEAALMFVRMMNASNGTSNPDPLQFNNVDALLYGFDLDWALRLSANWTLSGVMNYVRGERDDDSDDNLYRMAPPNTTVRLGYGSGNWSARIESVLYAQQDEVSAINAEQETSGYGVVNLQGTWRASEKLQLVLGVDNLFDTDYEDHLGGYNRAANPDIARGERLPGYGTNVYARLGYAF